MITPNEGQEKLLKAIYNWFFHSSELVFQYSGGPGTGKTFCLMQAIQRLGLSMEEILPMAYIGAAAINLKTKGLVNASTIHSGLFNPVQGVRKDVEGNLIMNTYLNRPVMGLEFEPKKLYGIKLIIIDEGYCVPSYLKQYIEMHGIKVLVCGDVDQLPPVEGQPAYLTDPSKIFYLTEIMRQARQSGIIYLKERIRQDLPIYPGYYGDAVVIYEDEMHDMMIAQSDIVICGKNDTRETINRRVRNQILGVDSELPTFGERVVCRKNNRLIQSDGINLANGLVGTVNNFPDLSGFDGKMFTIDFQPNLLVTAFKDIHCNYKYFTGNNEIRKKVKNDKFEQGECFEFAYAVTSHISQGAQYCNGIYIEEYLNPAINKKLNYVGATRFSNGLIYVIRRPKMYVNGYSFS